MDIQTGATGSEGSSAVYALVSVGDDNALTLTHFTVTIVSHGAVSVTQDHSLTHFTAHSSAITGKAVIQLGITGLVLKSLDYRGTGMHALEKSFLYMEVLIREQ